MVLGLVQSCHDLSEGGLGVAAAEMTFGGTFGLDIDLRRAPWEGESVDQRPAAVERIAFAFPGGSAT